MGNIVWLASYPKSGNTWLRVFLANLVADRGRPLPLAELPRYADDDARAQLYSEAAGRPSTELTPAEVCALRPRVHQRIAREARGTTFVKTHNLNGAFEGHPLHDWTVTAGAVCVVRNPLDVAVSMTHHFGLTVDQAIDFLAEEETATGNEPRWVTQIIGSWSTHVRSWADAASDRIIVLRYEDLLDKPAKHFARVAKLVGLDHDRARVKRAIDHAAFRTVSALEQRDGFIEASELTGARFFRVGRANQWRESLSREQAARIVAAHREQMQRFGYVPAGY